MNSNWEDGLLLAEGNDCWLTVLGGSMLTGGDCWLREMIVGLAWMLAGADNYWPVVIAGSRGSDPDALVTFIGWQQQWGSCLIWCQPQSSGCRVLRTLGRLGVTCDSSLWIPRGHTTAQAGWLLSTHLQSSLCCYLEILARDVLRRKFIAQENIIEWWAHISWYICCVLSSAVKEWEELWVSGCRFSRTWLPNAKLGIKYFHIHFRYVRDSISVPPRKNEEEKELPRDYITCSGSGRHQLSPDNQNFPLTQNSNG